MGFFFNENSAVKKNSSRKNKLEIKVSKETLGEKRCLACPRNNKKLESPKMKAKGSKKPLLYVLGSYPSSEDDQDGRVFSEKSILQNLIPIDDSEGVRWYTTLRCASEYDEQPNNIEIECCRRFIEEDIGKTKPKVIITVGAQATFWAIGTMATGVASLRGRIIPVQFGKHKCWLMPVLDPDRTTLSRKGKNNSMSEERFTERDLKKAHRVVLRKKLPVTIPKTKAVIFKDIQCIKGDRGQKDYFLLRKALRRLSTEKYLAVDLETYADKVNPTFDKSTLLPFAPNSRILTIALGTYNDVVAFAFDHPKGWSGKYKEKVKRLVKAFFMTCNSKFIAYNEQYEMLWIGNKLGKDVVDSMAWEDAMAAACAMDSRKYVLSFGMQTLFEFGFNIKHYSNLNMDKLIEEDLGDVLLYNGGDSKWTHQLFVKRQLPKMCSKYYRSVRGTYAHLVRSGRTLAHMQSKGLTPNLKALDKYGKDLSKKVRKYDELIGGTKQALQFCKKYKREYNPSSDKDNELLFSAILKRKEVLISDPKKEGGTKFSLDKNVLSSIKLSIAEYIAEYRRYSKLNGTYIEGTKNLIFPDGMLHPSINLMLTSTGRLSYDNPNGQNYPKKKDKYIRNVIKAGAGKWFSAIDFGQIEARCIGMASEDEAFCKMLWEDYDVHMDWAKRFDAADSNIIQKFATKEGLGKESDSAIWKAFRDKVKNGWVFPLFFGSHFLPASKSMLASNRVGEELYNDFWEVFNGVRKWQKYVLDFYNRKGYVETLTGRRRYGPLSKNEIINTPIQGTASDIVVNASNELYELDLTPNLNVHDDLMSELEKTELKKQARKVASVMCKPCFDFIIVPLVVEVSLGKTWGEMSPWREFNSSKDFNYH